MLLQRWGEARKNFERAIKADRLFADAYNNLGVVEYEQRKYRGAIKQYQRAIKLRGRRRLVLQQPWRGLLLQKGIREGGRWPTRKRCKSIRMSSSAPRGRGYPRRYPVPEDRARYDYVMAKLYAQSGQH